MCRYLSVYLSLSLSLDLAPSLSTSLSLCLSLSDRIAGGVDICVMLQQGSHHVQVPFVAREHKSRPALDEMRKEKNAH